MSLESNKQVVRDFFQAFNGGDLAKALSLTSEDFAWTITGTTAVSGTYTGAAAIEGLLAQIAEVIDFEQEVRLQIEELIAEGDKVVARVAGKTTAKSGKPYNNTYCHVFTVRDGKIQADLEYLDTALVDDLMS